MSLPQSFPIVLLGHTPEAERKVPCVDINNHNAAQMATEHLIQIGRKKILLLIPETLQHIQCMQERKEGYQTALKNHSIPVTSEYIHTIRCLPDPVTLFLKELPCLNEIDAIFCLSDKLAVLCMLALQAMNKKIPEDIAIIGFNNSPLTECTTPTLTSVHFPIEEQATAAIDLLLKILKKEIPYEPGFHEIETRIIVRESTVASPSQ